MKIRLLVAVLPGCLMAALACAADSATTSIIGSNEALAAGSRALQMGNFETGVRLTLDGLKITTRRLERARAFSNLCAGYAGLQDHQKALDACDEALALNSGNWRIYNNRALALLGLSRFTEARQDWKTALSLKPDSRKLLQTRAWIDAHAPPSLVASNPD